MYVAPITGFNSLRYGRHLPYQQQRQQYNQKQINNIRTESQRSTTIIGTAIVFSSSASPVTIPLGSEIDGYIFAQQQLAGCHLQVLLK
ncbi:MAG: hypothetical protein IPG00_03075 [Saprospiraceae bacterium]|nr:hypothetical protein [Saprospiraceae bacterium]